MAPTTAQYVVLASCALHNYMRKESVVEYAPPGYADTVDPITDVIVDGGWRSEVPAAPQRSHPSRTLDGLDVQNEFVKYFNSAEGSLEWQHAYINRIK